jgi:hypothetical protein
MWRNSTLKVYSFLTVDIQLSYEASIHIYSQTAKPLGFRAALLRLMLTCPVNVNSVAKRHRKATFALKERCAKYRWEPTVIPKPMKTCRKIPVIIKTLSYCLRFHMLPAFCILKFEWELISIDLWEEREWRLVMEWLNSLLSGNFASQIRWCRVSVEKLAFIQIARNYYLLE